MITKKPKTNSLTGSGLAEQLAEKGRRQNLRRKAVARAQSASARVEVRNDLSPPLNIVERAVADLKLSGRKVRPSSREHIEEVAASIRQFGVCAPLIVKGAEVIDGGTRLEAARLLGLSTIACVEVGHLNEPEMRQLRLALNRLGEKGGWDIGELRMEFIDLEELDFSNDGLGFDQIEIDTIMTEEEEPSEPEEDLEPAKTPPITRSGDLWTLRAHRVLCADARDPKSYELLMEGEGAALALTDPPYGCKINGHVSSTGKHDEFAMASGEMTGPEFQGFLVTVLGVIATVLRAGGLLAPFMDWRQIGKLLTAGEACGLELLNLVVWAKTGAGMGSLYRSQHELLPVFKKPGAVHINNVQLGVHGRSRSNLWTYPGATTAGSEARKLLDDHPTPKPVAMLADAILDVTRAGDIVLDPFLGSGSTLIAAERTGRRARGLELDPRYVDVILRRWTKGTGVEPVLAATGQTFSEVAHERAEQADDEPAEAQPPSTARAPS